MMTDQQGISFVLTRNPRSTTTWDAVSRCPHGSVRHLVFGPRDRIRQNARLLGPTHGIRLGCDCPLLSVEIDPDDREVGG